VDEDVDVVTRWLADLALTHAESTRRRYAKIMRGMARDLPEGVGLAACAERDIRTYLAVRIAAGIGPRTQRQTLSALRSWALWAIREGLRRDDPTRAIAWPKLPKTRQRPLSSAQLRQLARLLRSDPPRRRGASAWQFFRNCRAITVMLYAGLRLAEMGALTWAQIDLEAGLLYVERGKGSKDRVVPIHRELRSALIAVDRADRVGPVVPARTGGAMGPESLSHICQRWLPAMGVEDVTAHALRRACATLMRRGGADLETIRGVLGHESLATTEIYLGPDPELLRDGLDMLPGLADLMDAAPDIRALPRRRRAG
jgi:site-specific recombinase XerD